MTVGTTTISKRRNPFAALKHRSFRLFWSGQCVSLIGTWMQRASQAWLVLTIKDSPFLLGLVSAMQFVPVIFLGLFAGVIADRVSKKRMILTTQACLGLQAFVLAALVYTGKVQYWHVVVLAAFQGICTAFETPAYQSLIYEMVGKEDLMNAVALNSALFNAASIIGPAIGGFTMEYFGPAIAFLLNGFSYLFVLAALLAIKVPEATPKRSERNIKREIGEGIAFARQTPMLLDTLLTVGLVGVFALNASVLVPVLAKDVLRQGATGSGLLMSFMGAGALLGAVFLASFSHLGPQRKLLYGGAIALGTFEILQAGHSSFVVACGILFLMGWAQIIYSATANSTLQISTPDHLRGRVMSLYALLHQGSAPLGFLFAGTVMDLGGASSGFLACGVTTLLSVAFVLWKGRRGMDASSKTGGGA